jgi:hypothetical protein
MHSCHSYLDSATPTFSVVSVKVILIGVGWYMLDTGINGVLLSGGKTGNQPGTRVCKQAILSLVKINGRLQYSWHCRAEV